MSTTEKVTAFNKKLETLQKDTGLEFEVLPEILERSIDENRLFAGWFKPGTILANASNEKHSFVYEITGKLDAHLLNPDGKIVFAFSDIFIPFENGDVTISDDKDIEALADANHPSGYVLKFNSDNKVKVFVEDSTVEPIIAKDPSVARCILNKDIAMELKKAAFSEVKPKDRLPDAKINARLDALSEAAEELGGFEEMPDPPGEPEDENNEGLPISEDIPHYTDTEEGKAAISKLKEEIPDDGEEPEAVFPKPVKEEKNAAKKVAAKTKQTKDKTTKAKKTEKKDCDASDDEPVGRFDLLPLDIISRILANEDFDASGSKDLLSYIEEYKNSNDEEALVNAAMDLIYGYFTSPTDFVIKLAVLVEKDAEEQGEDAWKERDTTRCINEAIKGYLLFLKDGNEDEKLLRAAWNLICATWLAMN